jgi:hypothetical protein
MWWFFGINSQICIFRTISHTTTRIQAEKKTISSKDASHLELHNKKSSERDLGILFGKTQHVCFAASFGKRKRTFTPF